MSTTDERVVHPRPNRGVSINTRKMRAAREDAERFPPRGLTRVALGEMVGKTSAWVGQVERGLVRPSPKMLPVLAEALKLTEAELRAA